MNERLKTMRTVDAEKSLKKSYVISTSESPWNFDYICNKCKDSFVKKIDFKNHKENCK
jgi:hypothetical protein